MKNPNRILLADDHQIILDGLQTMLSQQEGMDIIGQANTGKEALQSVLNLCPDLVLMDLNMPEMNGMVAAAEIKKQAPRVKVIILSLHAEKSVIQHMMKVGIDGYIVKTADSNELLHAIRTVLEGGKYFSSDVVLSLSGVQTASGSMPIQSADYEEQLAQLSSREIEVLKFIAEGFSNKEVGKKLFLSPRTIDAHRANIMKKLAIRKVTGLVRFAVKAGLVD